MKKAFIYFLLILFVGGFVLKFFMGNTSSDELPATFGFKDNLATKWGESVQIDIRIADDAIQSLQLVYNDSTFMSWKEPKKDQKILFPAGYYGLGTRSLKLIATMMDGTTQVDERMVRVLSDVVPEIWTTHIENEFDHDPTSFTQGLEFDANQLYEGTGQRGQSAVAKVDINTGKITQKMGLDATYFGEGITIFKDKLYQLTWQEQKCLVYDKTSLNLLDDLAYRGEGWGLCNDGANLIMSDGTERITFRNPETFAIERTIEVYTNQGPVTNLNELEYINGYIYANIWMTSRIVVIEPLSGKVIAAIDAENIVQQGKGNGDVLNGIAYRKDTKQIFLTGKYWPKLFEVTFQQPTPKV